jgi:hypothetical protein
MQAQLAAECAVQMEAALWSPPAMRSQRVKSATNKALLSGDTRFEHLRDSTLPDVGPGVYAIELALPDVGTVTGAIGRGSPAKDADRMSSAFVSGLSEQQARGAAAFLE